MSPIPLEDIVFFDLETTGLDSNCRIVQIAMLRGEKIYQELINPEMPIPPDSTEIHRITDADVANSPTFSAVVDDVLAFIEGATLSGYNIRKFDIPVLKREVRRVGREMPILPLIDVFELNQKMNPRSLAWFYKHYTGESMDAEEAHDAVYDCICTRKGFLGMFEKHDDLPTAPDELAAFGEPERLPVADSEWLAWTPGQCEPCFVRGKYRGNPLSEVARKEASYLKWIKSIDADSSTKNLINLYQKNQDDYLALLRKEHPNRSEPHYLQFRHWMDHGKHNHFDDLEKLARQTQDPHLTFLAAAWAFRLKKLEIADEMAQAYLKVDDPYLGRNKRHNFLQKILPQAFNSQ